MLAAGGALLTGAAGAIGAGIALSAAPANATPEEDCAAVRARDHQIYLNLIASLPPGAPIPPEIINPCLSAPSTTATVAPTTTVGLPPGAQAPGGGPNVGANAPTNFPTYNGTPPIVPVPTIEVPPITSESPPASETGVGAFPPNASASAVPSPTPTPGEEPPPIVVPDRSPPRIRIRISHRPKRFRTRQQMFPPPGGRTRAVTGISNWSSSGPRRSPLRV